MDIYKNNWVKFVLGFIACLLIRLIPFRPPNIEPILATQMPFSKQYGALAGFLFAFLNIVIYDLLTQKIGLWTLLVAVTYGVLGIWAAYFFKNRENKKFNYVYFAIIGTIFFDGVTGLLVGPLFFGQSFIGALIGQIPFTLLHLVGNVGFALILSPSIYNLIIKNKKSEVLNITRLFSPKNI